MVVLNSTHSMFECSVLYIGSAAPTETLSGTDAIQEPLRARYPEDLKDVTGIDCTLRVRSDCLEMVQKHQGDVIQFPLDRLKICAAVRAVSAVDGTTGQVTRQFVPLNTLRPETSQPAIFTAIIRRNQGREIPECHAFVCSSPRDALHLVNTTAAANLNLKASKGQKMSESVKYQNGVPVIHDVRETSYGTLNGGDDVHHVIDGHSHERYGPPHEHITIGTSNGHYVDGGAVNDPYTSDNDTIYIKSSIIREPAPQQLPPEPMEQYVESNYQMPQQMHEPLPVEKPSTIYIKFDKSNLQPNGDDQHLQLRPSTLQYRSPPTPRPVVMPAPPPRVIHVPAATRPPPQPMVYRRPAPPRPVFMRPPPPQPVLVQGPPPPPMIVQRPLPPPAAIMPPPPRTVISAPPPGRMYARRIVSPPPQRMVAKPPMLYRTRARSTSPVFSRSDIRARPVIRNSKYQPKWRSHSSDIVEYRTSRMASPRPTGGMYAYPSAGYPATGYPATGYPATGYPTGGFGTTGYPTAYNYNNFTMYDRPVSKSNPRYSSSSSEDGDLRFSRKR